MMFPVYLKVLCNHLNGWMMGSEHFSFPDLMFIYQKKPHSFQFISIKKLHTTQNYPRIHFRISFILPDPLKSGISLLECLELFITHTHTTISFPSAMKKSTTVAKALFNNSFFCCCYCSRFKNFSILYFNTSFP